MKNYKGRWSRATLELFLHYDPTTQILSYTERPGEFFVSDASAKAWNDKFAGKPVTNPGAITILGHHIQRQAAIALLTGPMTTLRQMIEGALQDHAIPVTDTLVGAIETVAMSQEPGKFGSIIQTLVEMSAPSAPDGVGAQIEFTICAHVPPWCGRRAGIKDRRCKHLWSVLQAVGDTLRVSAADVAQSFYMQAHNYARKHGFKVSVEVDGGDYVVTRVDGQYI